MYSADCKFFAKSILKNRYGEAVLVTLVAMLLSGTCTGQMNMSSIISSYATASDNASFTLISSPLSFVGLILGGAVSLGYTRYLFALSYGEESSVSILFSEINRLVDGLVLKLLTSLYIVLWTLLFIVPGIMKTYSYAMAPYILAENPGMKASEAITHSKEIMYGHRFRLFCLHFSFIGWYFLAMLTFGIGFVFLCPYVEAACFTFYLDLTGRTPVAGE